MKKIITLIICIAFCATGFAQVSINNTGAQPDKSAQLDVSSISKGVLVPRMTTDQRNAIASPAPGLLVYDNTTTSFWYYNGTAWTEISKGSTGWNLTGNSGTDSTKNFIGTTDNQPLVFKINNVQAGLIDSSSYNTSLGFRNLDSATTGQFNAAFGYKALTSNNDGNYNTAIGSNTLRLNTPGSENTANGYFALYSNTTGSGNTASGANALASNTAGYSNTANGMNALYSNTTGVANTAIGNYALYFNTTGVNNTASGMNALTSNTSGGNNTAAGDYALYGNTIGNYNTASGMNALTNNTAGSNNTATGYDALTNNTTSTENTAIGLNALSANVTGTENTAIGFQANVSTGNLTNATAIGYNTYANASNKIRLGNTAVTVIEGQVPFTTPSDGRFKTNIEENIKGLDFINRLRPVSYNFETGKYEAFIKGKIDANGYYVSNAAYSASESLRHNGFIAQEVEKAAKESGYDFDGIVKPKSDHDAYGLSYSQFVVPLVKAVQELSRKNDELKETMVKSNDEKDAKIKELEARMDKIEALLKSRR